ncbi:MAG TPA: (Fe-S)-binding protein [Salinivirgaceae bacterium]|nr:(Fe-S)-binding protein [Salinivirgaceae bacterium]
MKFHPFVIPFSIGFILFFVFVGYKFLSWLQQLTTEQKKNIRQNFFSFKTIRACWETIRESLIHRNIYKTNPVLGYMHMSLALGWFLLIVVGKVESSIFFKTFWEEPWLPIFFKYFSRGSHNHIGANLFSFLTDFLLLIILSGVFLALIKRFYSQIFGMKRATKHVWYDKITLLTLWMVFPLRLLAESTTVSLHSGGNFLTGTVGHWMIDIANPEVEIAFWTAYSVVIGLFLATLPFSRYMHIPTEVVYIFLKNWGVKSEDVPTGFTQIQTHSCSRCGICIDVCQLNSMCEISNVQSVYFIRDTRYRTISQQVIENCLLCGRCEEACPVNLDLTKIRKQFRTKNEKLTSPNIMNINPKIHSNVEVVFFAGCMTRLNPTIIVAMKKIFDAAHINYWYIDEFNPLCCGRPLIQQGFIDKSQQLRKQITELIEASGAKTLVTPCPICYNSFREEFSLSIEILHHTQFIHNLSEKNRIQLAKAAQTFAYHDPCELSRIAKITDEPREILKKIGILHSTQHEKNNSLCCGGSLGNLLLSIDNRKQIANRTIDCLTQNNPNTLITACPLCKKTFHQVKKIPVLDIAEIVAQQLKIDKKRSNPNLLNKKTGITA